MRLVTLMTQHSIFHPVIFHFFLILLMYDHAFSSTLMPVAKRTVFQFSFNCCPIFSSLGSSLSLIYLSHIHPRPWLHECSLSLPSILPCAVIHHDVLTPTTHNILFSSLVSLF
ncbi:hypothetical protein F5Y16DRAFT_330151 [Xylariaceae sp. FL0255]|nr:hypothetical protein F5Y16DRAFT_330151 [Xylariaceae sp. FL0255]